MAKKTKTTTEFKFVIPATERAVNLGGLQNVIKVAHWRLTATNESGITAETYSTLVLGSPNPEVFTLYEDITEEIVISWVEQSLEALKIPVEEGEVEKSMLTLIKENLEKEIALKVSPEIIIEALPSKPI